MFNKRVSRNKNKSSSLKNSNILQTESMNGSTPYSDSQIISGYFLNEKSYKEMVIARVNNFLYMVLIALVLFCLVCYYFVSCKEVQLNQISRETLELNYENDELQYKVDSLQSYYNIDKAVSKTNILERAKNVVEIDAIDLPNVNFKKSSKKNVRSLVINY